MGVVSAYKIVGYEGDNFNLYIDMLLEELVIETEGERATISFDPSEVREFLEVLNTAVDKE